MSSEQMRAEDSGEIREVTLEEAWKIVRDKGPCGKYMTREYCMYTGILCDGTGKVEALAHRTETKCRDWLNGKRN